MKFCEKCGNKIADEAEVCLNCGCATGVQKYNVVAKMRNPKKKIVLLVSATVLAAALLVGVYFLINHFRVRSVVEDLSGRTFSYFDETIFPFSGEYSYSKKELAFDYNGDLTYSYYHSLIDAGDEYERDYQIRFRDGMIVLVAGIDEYEILYDKYDRIKGIYDYSYDELFE